MASSPVADLHFDNTVTNQLKWSYTSTGDYDQNMEVNVADVTPIGLFYQATSASANWAEARVADGDRNGEVNISDLTPIGANFRNTVTGYRVKTGPSETGPFGMITDSDVAFATATIPDGGGFKQFGKVVATAVEDAWYVVCALEGTTEAAVNSNAAQYSGTGPTLIPPANLAAVRGSVGIDLSWDAPVGAFPDGYDAYIASNAIMTDAVRVNQDPIVATTFEVPVLFSPDEEHYFGIRALYGAEQSNFSNIFHYTPQGGVPTNLTAVRDADHIRLDWTAPSTGAPDEYNAYIGTSEAMATSFQLNSAGEITGTTYDVSTLFSPDQEHWFGVKAVYGAVEGEYSNIAHYNPATETDPPTWDVAGEGIKSATPGDAQVTIEWHEATDTGSPPVTYLVYYAETSAGIDWGTYQETATGTDPLVISPLTNGTSYDFGVRARDESGNTTTNTNFLSATPVGGGTPVDSGIWQLTELVDDGGVLPNQDVGWFTDIEVKSDGTIGISHHNESGGDLLYTEKAGGTGDWTTVTVTSEGQVGQWNDLEFHPSTGHPCISYHNEDDASLVYAEFDGSEWNFDVVDSGGDKGAFSSLEFDPTDDNPAIAYFDAVAQDVRYAKYNGTDWDSEVAYNGQTSPLNMTGAFCDLAFNPTNNYPGISFMRTYEFSSLSMAACWITEWDGGGWDSRVVELGPYSDIEIDTAGWATNLCYSPEGFGYVIHCELLGDVMLSTNTGGPWASDVIGSTGQLTGGAVERIYTDIAYHDDQVYWQFFDKDSGSLEFGSGFGAGVTIEAGGAGGFPSFDISDTGVFHAAYVDGAGSDLRHAVSADGISWTPETAENGTGGEATVGEKASLAYHPAAGYPVISYYDASSSALKYADKETGSWRNETVSNDRNDGGASQMGISSTGTSFIGFFSIDTSYAGIVMAEGSFGSWDFDTIYEADLSAAVDVKGNYLAMAMSYPPTEAPGLAFHNTSQRRLEFAQGDPGGGYEITTVSEFGDPGRWNAVAYNPGNKFAAVASYARDSQDLWFCQRSGGGSWTPVIVDSAGMVGNRCSLAYTASANPRPWISYHDESNQRLKVAYVPPTKSWDEVGAWEFVTIPAPGGSTSYGSYSSIAWHPGLERMAVAFYDADNGKIWYVFIGDPAAPQSAVEVAGATDNEGSHLSLVFNPVTNQPGIAYLDITNGDLRYAWREPE